MKKDIIKQNMLPISMIAGAVMYLTYHYMPEPIHQAGPVLEHILAIVQPLLIFTMLFLTFCRIEPRELKPHKWHWWLLLIQGGSFTLLGLAIALLSRLHPAGLFECKVLIESAMLCLICPTATAAAVVTRKLGGDIPGVATYTILINILCTSRLKVACKCYCSTKKKVSSILLRKLKRINASKIVSVHWSNSIHEVNELTHCETHITNHTSSVINNSSIAVNITNETIKCSISCNTI